MFTHCVLLFNQTIDKQKIITEPPSPMANNFLTKVTNRKMVFNVYGYLSLVHFCIILIDNKGLGRGEEGKEKSLQLWEKMYTSAHTMPEHSSSPVR